MIEIQEISIPEDCRIINHDFYTYDPLNAFNEADSYKYLNEDIFQCVFPEQNLIVDVGWFGDIPSNRGEFRIHIIINENWDFPFNVIHSKSVEEVKELLHKIFKYYSKKEFFN